MTLKEVFGLPEAADPSAAMALNGGVAYSGGIWRTRCMGQIEFVVKKLAALSHEEGWEQMLQVIRLGG